MNNKHSCSTPLRVKVVNTVSTLSLLLALLLTVGCGSDELTVHFIDVGQGDSILIQSPKGYNVLIDGGPCRKENHMEPCHGGHEAAVVDYLQARNLETIHLMVNTHAHEDHYGGLSPVMANFYVLEVHDPGKPHTAQSYRGFLEDIDYEGIPFHTPTQGERFSVGDLDFQVLHPGADLNTYRITNDTSLVLRLTYGSVSFLFTGDAEYRAEMEMLDLGLELQAQILKVGHHGSQTSSHHEFVYAVMPEVAVIQVGEGNRYGLPNDEPLDNLEAAGARIYRTDFHGDVIVTTDGKGYQVRTSH